MRPCSPPTPLLAINPHSRPDRDSQVNLVLGAVVGCEIHQTRRPLLLLHLVFVRRRRRAGAYAAGRGGEEAGGRGGGEGRGAGGRARGLARHPGGRVVKAWLHPEADTLYVEEVDVGEEQPRTICSGLVKYLSLDQLQDSNVIVLANLKPRNMRGIKSNGMLMCASDAAHETVELLTPPEGSVPGERVWFGSEDEKSVQSEPATGNQVQKKKIWESVQPHLKTTDNCIAVLGEHPMRTSAGKVFCKSLQGAGVS